jgi:hypothetical protein
MTGRFEHGPTMCPTGSTLQITRRDCRPRWTISPLPLNAERRLPRSTVLVATATIRVVATEGQIYGRQLQQAGDYTGPHRDLHRRRAPGQIALREPHHLALEDHRLQHGGTVLEHFDVTDGVRTRAIAAGATPITYREMGELVERRRALETLPR